MLGSTQQVARILFEKLGLEPGPKGQDRLLDRQPRPPRAARRARDRAGDRGVARVLEAAQHLPPAAAVADLRAGRPAPHDVQPGRRRDRAALDHEPEPAVDPDPHRPRPPDPLGLHRRGGASAALGRLQPGRAAHPRPRLRRAGPARGLRAGRGHPHAHGGRGARQGSRDADALGARRREDGQLRDHLRDLVVRARGEPRDPARRGAGVHRHLPRALPARAGVHRAHDRAGGGGRLRDDAARPAAPDPRAPRLEPPDAVARRAARGQHRHAGHRRRRDQGRDDPRPRPAAGRGPELPPRPPGARRAAARGARTPRSRACEELVREEMVGAYPLDPPLAVDVGVGDNWADAK